MTQEPRHARVEARGAEKRLERKRTGVHDRADHLDRAHECHHAEREMQAWLTGPELELGL